MRTRANGLSLGALVALLWSVGAAGAAPLGKLELSPATPFMRLDGGAVAVRLLRVDLDGGVASAASLASPLLVSLSSSSASTSFSPSATGPWTSGCTASFGANQSTSSACFARESQLRVATLHADAGAVWSAAEGPLVPLLEEDGSRGGVLTTDSPAGQWTRLADLTGGNTFAVGTGHRGPGVIFHDVDPNDSQSQGSAELLFQRYTGDLWMRTWMQTTETQIFAGMTSLGLSGPNPDTGASLSLFNYGRDPQGLRIGGRSPDGGYFGEVLSFSLDANWHLVEAEVSGLGTPLGRRRLWVDGVLRYVGPDSDYSALSAWKLIIGEDYIGIPRFAGDIAYDDLRVQGAPPASSVHFSDAEVRLPAACQETTQTCVPVRAELRDPDGAPAAAPLDVALPVTRTSLRRMSASATLTLFSDPLCANSAPPIIPLGETSTLFGAKVSGCAAWSLAYRGGSADDLLAGAGADVVVSGFPVRVGVRSPGTFVQAGECVAKFALEARDAADNPVVPAASVDAQVTVTGGQAYREAACSTPSTGETLGPSAPAAEFFLRAAAPGPLHFEASAQGLGPGTLDVTAVSTRAVLHASTTTVQPGGSVVLDATGSTPSAASSSAGGAATLSAQSYAFRAKYAPAQVTFTAGGPVASAGPLTVPGDYELEVVVTDSEGFHGPPASVSVHVPGELIPRTQRLGCGCNAGDGSAMLLLACGSLLWACFRKSRHPRR